MSGLFVPSAATPPVCTERLGGVAALVSLVLAVNPPPRGYNPGADGSAARRALEAALLSVVSAALPQTSGRVTVASSALASTPAGETATVSPTLTPTASRTVSRSASSDHSATPSLSPSASKGSSATPSTSESATASMSSSPSASATGTTSAIAIASVMPVATASRTPSRSPRHSDDDRRRTVSVYTAPSVALNITLLVQRSISMSATSAVGVVPLTALLLAQALDASTVLYIALAAAGFALQLPAGADFNSAVNVVSVASDAASALSACSSLPFFPRMPLGDRMAVSWRVQPATCPSGGSLDIVLYGPTDTWFGLAINDGVGMVGGDAVTVEPATGTFTQVSSEARAAPRPTHPLPHIFLSSNPARAPRQDTR